MDRFNPSSLDAEIERYTRQMMSDYQKQGKAADISPIRLFPPTVPPVPVPSPPIASSPVIPPPVASTPVEPPSAQASPVIPPDLSSPVAPVPVAPPSVPAPPTRAPAMTPEQEYARFSAENPQRGSIKTQAFTARGTYPVKDVNVVISKVFESGEYIIATQKTDIAGKTEPVTVPAPDVNLSESPGQKIPPFSSYKVTFTHPSFATIISKQVPVFSGTTAMQTVNMVPLSAAPGGNSTIEYITTEPSDL